MATAKSPSRAGNRGTHKRLRDAVSAADFYRGAVTLFGGSGHGLRVGVIVDAVDGDMIEISGFLPPALRTGLCRAHAYWEQAHAGSVPWDAVPIVWHASRSGYGARLAIPDLGTLLDLVAERRRALEGALAC